MNDLSEADITDNQEWIDFLESNFEKGLEVVKADYVKLQALEVLSRAEEVQAEFLDLYKETIDVLKGLPDSLKTWISTTSPRWTNFCRACRSSRNWSKKARSRHRKSKPSRSEKVYN